MPDEMGTGADDMEAAALPVQVAVPPGSREEEIDAAQLSPDDNGSPLDHTILTTCPCKKPKKGEFFRARAGPEWVRYYYLYQMQEGEEIASDFFLVHPRVAPLLEGHAVPCELRYCINRNGAPFLFPIKKGENTRDIYKSSLLYATSKAETSWIRIRWEKERGGYSVFQAQGDLGEPNWPDDEIPDMTTAISFCFRDRFIKDESHEAVTRLLGL